METVYKEFKGENFEILAVSIDALGAKAVAPFMKKYNLSFPALLDPEGTIKTLYQTTGVPESFIINRQGILRITSYNVCYTKLLRSSVMRWFLAD